MRILCYILLLLLIASPLGAAAVPPAYDKPPANDRTYEPNYTYLESIDDFDYYYLVQQKYIISLPNTRYTVDIYEKSKTSPFFSGIYRISFLDTPSPIQYTIFKARTLQFQGFFHENSSGLIHLEDYNSYKNEPPIFYIIQKVIHKLIKDGQVLPPYSFSKRKDFKFRTGLDDYTLFKQTQYSKTYIIPKRKDGINSYTFRVFSERLDRPLSSTVYRLDIRVSKRSNEIYYRRTTLTYFSDKPQNDYDGQWLKLPLSKPDIFRTDRDKPFREFILALLEADRKGQLKFDEVANPGKITPSMQRKIDAGIAPVTEQLVE